MLFPDNFIELMGIEDRVLIDAPSETGFRFGRFIADQLNRREGIAMIALHSDDAAADVAAVTARGVEPDGLVNFRREVTLPDGAQGRGGGVAGDADRLGAAAALALHLSAAPAGIRLGARVDAASQRRPGDRAGGRTPRRNPMRYGSASPASGARPRCTTWATASVSRPRAANCWCWTGRRRRHASPRWRCPTAGATHRARSRSPSRRGHQPGAPDDDAERGAAPAHGGGFCASRRHTPAM